MIERHLMVGALLAAGCWMFSAIAQADEKRVPLACEHSDYAKCAEGSASLAGNSSRPISAARSDALKKRQLAEMIRMNESELLRDEKTPMNSVHPTAEKRL